MFSLQRRFFEEALPCTRDDFYQVAASPDVARRIALAREALARGDRKGYDAQKRGLPMFTFQCTFDATESAKGRAGHWRKQSAARLNGLVMLDFDHTEDDPRELWQRFTRNHAHWLDPVSHAEGGAVVLAHVTPSGRGLRVVITANRQAGNLADNQLWWSRQVFGMESDAACKNADRTSFAVTKSDILFINDEILFDYDDEKFREMYGAQYRAGHSNPSRPAAGAAAGAPADGADGGADGAGAGHTAEDAADDVWNHVTLETDKDGAYTYHGVTFDAIIQTWADARGGWPSVGDRHRAMLTLANQLRHICDYSRANLLAVLRNVGFVADVIREAGGNDREVRDIIDSACGRQKWQSVPRQLRAVLARAGVPAGDGGADTAAASPTDESYSTWAARLEPLLQSPYREAVALCDRDNWLGAIFAAGTMYCTLMTRCWYKHFDGNPRQRMNPQAYIIGEPASGKSFAYRLDRNIMAAMRAKDEVVRQAEARYKQERRERGTSTKAQKGDALKKPEGMVRYIPSRTSNAVFYDRALRAKETVGGELMQLHLYTFDSELDSSITAQSGGSWIGKHDLELKAFHNEWSGVDYANLDSVNQNIQVFYNTVVTGTPVSMQKKISLRNIMDGLCSRVVPFRMKSDGFKMMPRGGNYNHDTEVALKTWGFRFEELSGELPLERLTEHVYQLCELSAFEAEASGDRVLDYLRKRAVFYATWLTVPRIVARQYDAFRKTRQLDITDDDLRWATLMYDAVLYWQDHFFGQMLQEAWDNATKDYVPRRRQSANNEVFAQLPKEFTTQQAARLFDNVGNAKNQLSRWATAGYLERKARGRYVKVIERIV